MIFNILSKLLSSSITPSNNHDGYFYSCLNSSQRKIYEAVLSCLSSCSKETSIPSCSMNELSMIFNGVLKDNPLIFYSKSFTRATTSSSSNAVFRPDYDFAHHTIKQYIENVGQYLRKFDGIRNSSDLDKELFVHDYCLKNFKYDWSFQPYSYSVLGPIFNQTAVCEGIAKFVKLVFDYVGLKSLVPFGKLNIPSSGSTDESHAWNIVSINGKFYHLDVTVDITMHEKINRYDYFNLCDEDIRKDHICVDKVPACTTAGDDYYTMNSCVVNNLSELETYISTRIKQGKRDFIVKLKNVNNTGGLLDKVISIAQEQYLKLLNKSVYVMVGFNDRQMVFEINYK